MERAVALEHGLAMWVSAAMAVDHADAQAAPANFSMSIEPGAPAPWVVTQATGPAMVEGQGSPVPYDSGAFAPSNFSFPGSASGDSMNQGTASLRWGWQNANAPLLSFSQPTSAEASSLTMEPASATPALPSSMSDLTGVSGPFPTQRSTYDSTLTDRNPTESVQFPIGPAIRGLSLAIASMGGLPSMEGMVPYLQGVSVTDSSGDTIAQAVPDLPSGGFSAQAVALALQNAPVGGRLVVQISALQSQSNSGTLPNPSAIQPSGTWSVPFSLQVTGQDSPSPVGLSADSLVQGGFSAGPLTVALLTITGVEGTGTAPALAVSDPLSFPGALTAASPSPLAVVETESSTPGDGWLPTGPLVSRSAGPLGLVLASMTPEPTAGVDRTERAFSDDPDQANLGLERMADHGPDSQLAQDSATTEDGTADSRTNPGVVAVARGEGLLPLYATSGPTRRRGDLALLLADTSAGHQAEIVDSSAETLPAIPAQTNSTSAEHQAAGDVIRAALGLVVGLSLTSGPLLSDLISHARSARLGRAQGQTEHPSNRKPRTRAGRLAGWFTSFFG